MPKTINYDLQKQREGIYKAVDIVKITIGPRGKNVSLSNGDTVNDAKRILEDLTFKDPAENKGVIRVRNLVRRISQDVGGGRTACAILYKTLIEQGSNLLERGFNFNFVRQGMELAVKDITEQLERMSRPTKKKELEQIATISTEREELGKVIADTTNKIGKDGVVSVEESNTLGVRVDLAKGLKYDKGWISRYMVNNTERMEATYKDMPVYITDRKISSFSDLIPVMETVAKGGGKNLFVIAEDLDESVLRLCAFHRDNGLFNVLATKAPGVGDMKRYTLEDLGQLTGATVITNLERSTEVKNISIAGQTKSVKLLKADLLGSVEKVISNEKSTILIGGGGDLKTWLTTLKTRKELAENKWEIDQYVERIAKLSNGIAVIKVGAPSEDEVKYLKLKIEDGVNETKRALEEGILMGGNVSFLHAVKSLGGDTMLKEEALGYSIVRKALEAPLRQIVENSKGSPDVVINEINKSDSLTMGYDSLENKVVDDMYSLGIIDAAKVVKTVLTNAVSEAAMFLSLGGDISEELKEEKQ